MTVTSRESLSGGQRAALGLLAAAIFGGCTTLAPTEPPLHVYTGRFAAGISRGSERETVSGRFTLAAYPGRTTLDLASPLNNTLARIETDATRGATLTAPQPDGTLARWHGNSPDTLAESVLGYNLPVAGLADWIAGRSMPGRPARTFPETGPAQRIEQDGWIIVVDERFGDTGMPRRLSFDRATDGPTGTSLKLRLVLDAPGEPEPMPR